MESKEEGENTTGSRASRGVSIEEFERDLVPPKHSSMAPLHGAFLQLSQDLDDLGKATSDREERMKQRLEEKLAQMEERFGAIVREHVRPIEEKLDLLTQRVDKLERDKSSSAAVAAQENIETALTASTATTGATMTSQQANSQSATPQTQGVMAPSANVAPLPYVNAPPGIPPPNQFAMSPYGLASLLPYLSPASAGLSFMGSATPTPTPTPAAAAAGAAARAAELTAAMFHAVHAGRAEDVALLLANGANPNARDADGNSILHWAARSGNEASVLVLVNAGASKSAPDAQGNLPFHVAATDAVRGRLCC